MLGPLGGFLLLIAALTPALIGAGARDFWRPDEPDYALHAREMLRRGDFSVPYQNGQPFAEKPVLLYWLILATTPFTGGDVTPFGARVPSLLGAGMLLFAAAGAARWMGEDRDGPLALMLLATTPLFFWQAHVVQMDALFSGLLALALLVQIREASAEQPSRLRALGGHVALGLAVLTKGPLAIAVCVLVALVAAGALRSPKPLRAAFPLQGAAVVTLLALPWYAFVIGRLGWPFASELIVRHNLERFAAAWDHVHPLWYYVSEKVWSDFFPWTLPLLAAAVIAARRGSFRPIDRRGLSLLVFGASILLLSLSRSKQGKYLLFAYPFAAASLAAILGDARAATKTGANLRGLRISLGIVACLCLLGGLALPAVAVWRFPEHARVSPLVALPLALGGGLALVFVARRLAPMSAVLSLVAGLWLGQIAVAATVLPAIDLAKTARPLYERLRARIGEGEPLAYASSRFRGYPLLVLDRPLEHLADSRALRDWLAENPQGWVIGPKQELDEWWAELPVDLRIVDSQPEGGGTALVLRRSLVGSGH